MNLSSRCLAAAGLVLATLVVAVPSSATSPPPLPTGVGCEAHASVRPSQIILSCADDNSYFGSIHWSSWTATGATGVGQFMLNPCSPNCVTSLVADRGSVRLVAGSPRTGPQGRVFTRLRVTMISTKRSVTLTWAWASSITQIGTWQGSTTPLTAAH